jgi:hypothetical protein
VTLILSCATPDYVFQVSDRRLTAIAGPNPGAVIDEHANKVTVVGGRLAFGYTGISQIAGVRSDLWLVDVVKHQRTQNLRLVCEHLRVRASEEFRAMARTLALQNVPRALLRHVFAGVGWVRRPDVSFFEPIYVTVSNALDANGEWLPNVADEFTTSVDVWRDYGGFRIQSAGTTLEPIEKKAIWRHLARLARKRAGARAFLRALVDCELFVARRRTSVVGRNLLALCMPRVAAEKAARGKPFTMVASLPMPEMASFLYVPESGPGPVHYGPNVTGDGAALTHLECGEL